MLARSGSGLGRFGVYRYTSPEKSLCGSIPSQAETVVFYPPWRSPVARFFVTGVTTYWLCVRWDHVAFLSTAGVERVFSAAGRMHNDLRKSMKDSTLEHSLFARFNTL